MHFEEYKNGFKVRRNENSYCLGYYRNGVFRFWHAGSNNNYLSASELLEIAEKAKQADCSAANKQGDR